MSKLTPQILGMYIGCEAIISGDAIALKPKPEIFKSQVGKLTGVRTHWVHITNAEEGWGTSVDGTEFKIILRRLEDMTEEEATDLVLKLWSDEDIEPNEIDVDVHPDDGGNMLDGDMACVIEVWCRCFEGQIGVRKCGSIILFDEVGTVQRVHNVPQAFQYLLSKGFDLFNLISSGDAIDAKTFQSQSLHSRSHRVRREARSAQGGGGTT